MTLDMVGALAILVSPSQVTDSVPGTNFGIAIVYWALSIPLGWVFWYRPLYNAASYVALFLPRRTFLTFVL